MRGRSRQAGIQCVTVVDASGVHVCGWGSRAPIGDGSLVGERDVAQWPSVDSASPSGYGVGPWLRGIVRALLSYAILLSVQSPFIFD